MMPLPEHLPPLPRGQWYPSPSTAPTNLEWTHRSVKQTLGVGNMVGVDPGVVVSGDLGTVGVGDEK